MVAAKVATAQFLRQKDQVEEQQAERGPSQYAAKCLAAREQAMAGPPQAAKAPTTHAQQDPNASFV